HNIQHPVLQWVQNHDVRTFYENEIKQREYFAYPPYTRLIKVTFKHRDEPKAVEGANQMVLALQAITTIGVQGPVPALVPRVRNQFIQEVWIKCPRDARIIEMTKSLLMR